MSDRSSPLLVLATTLCLQGSSLGAPRPSPGLTSAEVLAASSVEDWKALDPESTLYLETAGGRVVIELAPGFAPRHVANIKTLVREGYFNGLAITRVQENYVVQWGDPAPQAGPRKPLHGAQARLPAEFTRTTVDLPFTPLADGDVYARQAGWSDGFPVAIDARREQAWIAHCYGVVGAGRDNAADSSNGTELYAIIGQAPRHLDRNMTVVGRAVWGLETLTALPRGTGAMGFYEKAEQKVPIRSVRLAADVAVEKRELLERLRTDTKTFAAYVESRRNRREPFFVEPLGHVDLCNVPIPVRLAKTGNSK